MQGTSEQAPPPADDPSSGDDNAPGDKGDDQGLSRYVEAGMALLALAQSRAETWLKDVSTSGEAAITQTHKATEWLAERGRKGTEELLEAVRREIREQVKSLGLATRDDIARLEARLEARLPPRGGD